MQTTFKIYVTKEQQDLITAIENNWGKNYERKHYKKPNGSYTITKWKGKAHCREIPIIKFVKGKSIKLFFNNIDLGDVIGFEYDEHEGDYCFEIQLNTENGDVNKFNSLLTTARCFDLEIYDKRPIGLDSFGWTVVTEYERFMFEDARATDDLMFG